MKMESSGADSRGGIDRFPEEGLVTFERRFWEEGRVRNKSMKLKRYLQVSHQQKSMFTCPKACAVRRDIRRWKRKDMTEHPRVIALPGQLTSYGSLSQTDTHTHTHTHTGVDPCHHERTITFSYSFHLPVVFNIFSQHIMKS